MLPLGIVLEKGQRYSGVSEIWYNLIDKCKSY